MPIYAKYSGNRATIGTSSNYGRYAPGQAPPPFAPTQIPGLQLWLDGADSTTITLNGSNVSQWSDKSGNANNAYQPVAVNQPQYVAAAHNGKNSLRFIGNPVDRAASNYLTGALSGISSLTSTIFIVGVENIVDGLFSGFFDISNQNPGAFNTYLTLFNAGYSLYFRVADSSGSTQDCSYPSPFGEYSIFRTEATTSGSSIWQNSVLQASATYSISNPTNSQTYSIGAGLPPQQDGVVLNGDISEVVIYNSILSGAQISQVEAYLKAKWATP